MAALITALTNTNSTIYLIWTDNLLFYDVIPNLTGIPADRFELDI